MLDPLIPGEYAGWVPGAGCDVWLIRHGEEIAAYMCNEILDLPKIEFDKIKNK